MDSITCPFCGGNDIRFHNHGKISRDLGHREDDVWSTCCYDCGATFPQRYRKELLVECWRRRPRILENIKSRLQWTSEQPSVDGWFWWKRRENAVPEPVEVWSISRAGVVESRQCKHSNGILTLENMPIAYPDQRWAGPIQPPPT